LTRHDSKSLLPEGVKAVQINYDDESTIVAALQGQQVLIITMSVMAPPGTQSKLIQAAAKAGVSYVIPNTWGWDFTSESFSKEIPHGSAGLDACAEIEAAGMSWIAVVCSFWYEHSLLTGSEWFGFDFKEKKIIFFDDGNTKINVGTWELCGWAVSALLSLKDLPEDENDQSPTVSTWRNKPLYISSFLISQKDMFESWKRVTGDKDEDWTIDYEPTTQRYKKGLDLLQQGNRVGYAMAMYSRVFYPDGDGDYENKHGLANSVLGLPKESLDECTKVAVKMLDSGWSYFNRVTADK
jgi:hypothetical protein